MEVGQLIDGLRGVDMAKLYKSSIGNILELDTKLDVATLAAATSPKMLMSRPDGTTKSLTASVVATTSKLRYTFVATDLTVSGKYGFQASVILQGSAAAVLGDTVSIQVFDDFQ